MSKRILITGCNKGVGYGILKTLAAKYPAYKFIMAIRSISNGITSLKELDKTVPGISLRTMIQEVDISNEKSINSFVSWLEDQKLKIDCLINNAGMAYKGDIFNEEVIRNTFQTNFYGTILLTEKILPYIVDNGKIIFVASSVGKFRILKDESLKAKFESKTISKEELFELAKKFYDDVVAGTFEKNGWPRSAYGMSKLCLNIYNRILGRDPDILKRGIQVYSCCPGWVRTDMAGPKATRSIEEGAVCPSDLVGFPWKIDPTLQGQFFYDSKVTSL